MGFALHPVWQAARETLAAEQQQISNDEDADSIVGEEELLQELAAGGLPTCAGPEGGAILLCRRCRAVSGWTVQ